MKIEITCTEEESARIEDARKVLSTAMTELDKLGFTGELKIIVLEKSEADVSIAKKKIENALLGDPSCTQCGTALTKSEVLLHDSELCGCCEMKERDKKTPNAVETLWGSGKGIWNSREELLKDACDDSNGEGETEK